MRVIVWHEEERYLGEMKQKVKENRGKEGEGEVRFLEMPFKVKQMPQDFNKKKRHCVYNKVYRTAVLHKRPYK